MSDLRRDCGWRAKAEERLNPDIYNWAALNVHVPICPNIAEEKTDGTHERCAPGPASKPISANYSITSIPYLLQENWKVYAVQ